MQFKTQLGKISETIKTLASLFITLAIMLAVLSIPVVYLGMLPSTTPTLSNLHPQEKYRNDQIDEYVSRKVFTTWANKQKWQTAHYGVYRVAEANGVMFVGLPDGKWHVVE